MSGGSSAKPFLRPTLTPQACYDSEGPSRDLHTGSSQSSFTRSSKQTFAPVSAKTSVSKPVVAQCCLELFSGSSRLTSALQCRGLRCCIPFDICNGWQFDLSRHDVQRLVLDWIKTGRVWYCHLGTPCTTFSIANTNKIKESRVKLSLSLARFTARVIRTCVDCGVMFSLENPMTSKLFKLDCIHKALSYSSALVVIYDSCRYGCPFRKSTILATNCSRLAELGKRCTCQQSHPEQLRGRVRVAGLNGDLKWFWKTSLAGEYSGILCHQWARLLRREAPKHVLLGDREPSFLPGWYEEIEQVVGARPTELKVQRCPTTYTTPWKDAVEEWGTGPKA